MITDGVNGDRPLRRNNVVHWGVVALWLPQSTSQSRRSARSADRTSRGHQDDSATMLTVTPPTTPCDRIQRCTRLLHIAHRRDNSPLNCDLSTPSTPCCLVIFGRSFITWVPSDRRHDCPVSHGAMAAS